MNKASVVLILGLLWGMIPPLSLAQQDTKVDIIYGYPDVSVWTTRRDHQGALKNPLLKLADALFDGADLSWQARPYPARRLFSYLKEGVVPFSMLVRASSLEECCLFSRKPVTSTELRIYRRAQVEPIATQQDLIGKQVILIRGYSYGSLGRYLRAEENQVGIIDAADHAAAFRLLERNRGDYVIDYQGPAQEVLSDHPIDDVIEYDTFKRLDVFLVLSRDYPDAPVVMNRLEALLENLDVSSILKAR